MTAHWRGESSQRAVFLAGVAVIAALGATAEFTTFARSDMAFLLYAAGRVLDGAKLYVDVLEINPPLIIALNLPAVWLARAVGVSDILVYRLLAVAALFASLALCRWLLDRVVLVDERRAVRRRLVLLLAFVLFLYPGIDFGQREHLLLALALPYLLLSVARATGRAIPTRPAFGVGVMAGIGLALKPHFLLLWVTVELYLRLRSKDRRLAPFPESFGIAAFLFVYGAGILLLAPNYLPLVATLGPAYAGYLKAPFLHVLVTAPGTTVVFLGVLTMVALAARARHSALWRVLGIAIVASFLAGAAQQKAWTYHFYPATACALVLLGLVSADVRRPFRTWVQRLYGAIAVAAVVVSIVWAGTLAVIRIAGKDPARALEQAQLDQLEQAVQRHAADGGSLFILSYTIGSSFPLVNYSGVHWASRFPHLWILEATYQDQLQGAAPLRYHTREEMDRAERLLNDIVYEDLARAKPSLLLVLRHARDKQVNGLRRLDYVTYFRRDPRVAEQLDHYRFAEDVGEYRLYRRVEDPAGAAGEPPVSRPGTLDIVRHEVRGARALIVDRTFVLNAALFLAVALLALVRQRRDAPVVSEPRGPAAGGQDPEPV